jgi:AcrR family transcriptional regulator
MNNYMVTSTADKILIAGCQEIYARGSTGARVDEIARLAGVNKRMIYHHFGNKAGLCEAVVQHQFTRALHHPLLSDRTREVLLQVGQAVGLDVAAVNQPDDVVNAAEALHQSMTTLLTEIAQRDVSEVTRRVDMQDWLSFCLEATSWMLARVTPVLFGRRIEDATVREVSDGVSAYLEDWNGGRRKMRLTPGTRKIH